MTQRVSQERKKNGEYPISNTQYPIIKGKAPVAESDLVIGYWLLSVGYSLFFEFALIFQNCRLLLEKNMPEEKKLEANAPRRGPRRLLIGANVVLSVILVAALVVAANFIAWWLTSRYDLTADATVGHQNSFSSRTKILLQKLDQPVHLTSLYTAEPKDAAAAERKRRVEDLLHLYRAANSRYIEVEFIDPTDNPAAFHAVAKRITDDYATEAKPYVAAIGDFLKFKTELQPMLLAEKERYAAVARDGEASAAMKEQMHRVTEALDQLITKYDEVERGIDAWTSGGASLTAATAEKEGEKKKEEPAGLGIPDYTQATSTIAKLADATAQVLDQIGELVNKQLQVEGLKMPETIRHDLQGADARYKPIQKQLLALSKQATQLKPLELDTVRNALSLDSIIVEADGKVRVVGYEEMWSVPPGASRMDPTVERRFNGEDVLSAALTRAVSSNRVAAVFVQSGGMPVSENYGRYTEMVERLKRANFEVATWDVARSHEPPKVAGTASSVYILMAPEPPDQQRPTPPPSPDQYQGVTDLVNAGGRALVLCRTRISPMMPDIPFTDLLHQWGLTARTDLITAASFPAAEGDKNILDYRFDTSAYPSETNFAAPHPIVKPLEGIKARFFGPVPLEIAKSLPAGEEIWSLVETPRRPDIWADKDIQEVLQNHPGAFKKGEDLPSPYPVAVAAVRAANVASGAAAPVAAKKSAAKLVVFGDDIFASDELMRAQLQMTGKGELVLLDNPANGELVVNAMLWLSDQQDLIAVSAKAQEARRLGVLPSWLSWGLPIGIPVAVILLGLVVYWIRSRAR
jgi:ABC-type uncharacterized transport system involved in gliding motility auxiliary subunit